MHTFQKCKSENKKVIPYIILLIFSGNIYLIEKHACLKIFHLEVLAESMPLCVKRGKVGYREKQKLPHPYKKELNDF